MVETVSGQVDQLFLKRWPFPSDETRAKFKLAQFSHVTCLYFPKAKDNRIRHACELLSILFLIDDLLEELSLEEGRQHNQCLIAICRGEKEPDDTDDVQVLMADIWSAMTSVDHRLTSALAEPVCCFLQAQTDSKRLSIKCIQNYFEYREHDVGKA